MGFSTRRGRPRLARTTTDTGTPELRQKRRHSLTSEPLDYMLQQGLLSPNQHWCALHFRWLYVKRYGSATVRGVDPAALKGRHIFTYDPQMQEQVEVEWRRITDRLQQAGLLRFMLHYCVHQLSLPSQRDITCAQSLSLLRSGLDILASLWCKRTW